MLSCSEMRAKLSMDGRANTAYAHDQSCIRDAVI